MLLFQKEFIGNVKMKQTRRWAVLQRGCGELQAMDKQISANAKTHHEKTHKETGALQWNV